MTTPSSEHAAHELARMSIMLADALEAGDLATAERLADERGEFIDRCLGIDWVEETRSEELTRLGSLIVNAEGRGHRALDREIETLRRQLAVLVEGNRAVAAYHSTGTIGPGLVDRRD